VMEPGWFPH